jgi:precorrin-8X/cobalt-precorrin-8 methylmutase
LLAGRPVVTDAEMVAAGITSVAAVCRVKQATAEGGLTRSAMGMRLALQEVGKGAIWVIGNAPTALEELLKLDAAPALIVGLPVGFVGAVESKEALRSSGFPAISNVSEKGGSAVAAAALNALLYAPIAADQAVSTS